MAGVVSGVCHPMGSLMLRSPVHSVRRGPQRGDRVGVSERVLVTLERCNALLFLTRVLQRYALQRVWSPPAPPPGKRSFVLRIFTLTLNRGN